MIVIYQLHQVIGKFSIRLVPDMTPAEIEQKVITFMNAEFAKFNSGWLVS
jgi:Cys-Gly metallodipeptidase DUG1